MSERTAAIRAPKENCDTWIRPVRRPERSPFYLATVFVCLMFGLSVAAEPGGTPRIAIIIDDMGNALADGRKAIALPGAITYAFLPHTPFARRLAEQAHGMNKEIMLHLPMQSGVGGRPGPGVLTLHMTEREFRETLDADLDAVPHVTGINNHMGSLLTQHPGAMDWLMEALKDYRDLYFIDSRTSVLTVAQQVAEEHGVAHARRDVFLDNIPTAEAIRAQLRRLVRKARSCGVAIGIGHPYKETIEVLQEELPRLRQQGIRLVRASELTSTEPRRETWHACLSPLPKVARNSKRSPSSICCDARRSR